MKRITKIIIAAALVLLILFFAERWLGSKTYDYELNTIESIKYYEPTDKKYAYSLITLTPTKYSRSFLSQSVIAKAIYKGKVVGIELVYCSLYDEITFQSIGGESNQWIQVLGELYEERMDDSHVMRETIPSYMGNDGAGWINWMNEKTSYKIVVPLLDGRTAEIHLSIDLPNGVIKLGDRHYGLAKRRFVDAFRE